MIQHGDRTLLFRTIRRNTTILKRPVLHITITDIPICIRSDREDLEHLFTLIGGQSPETESPSLITCSNRIQEICDEIRPDFSSSGDLSTFVKIQKTELDLIRDMLLSDHDVPVPDGLVLGVKTRMILAMLTSFRQDIQVNHESDGSPPSDQNSLSVEQYRGILASAALSMNHLIRRASVPREEQTRETEVSDSFLSQLTGLAKSVLSGDLSVRLEPGNNNPGQVSEAVLALNGMIENIEDQHRAIADCIGQMKTGFIPIATSPTQSGPFDPVIRDLDAALTSLQTMIAKVESLTMAVMEGDLTARGIPTDWEDITKHSSPG